MPEAFRGSEVGPLLVLTPTGRDSDRAAELLERESIPFRVLRDGRALGDAIDETIGAVLVADEALVLSDLSALRRQLDEQPAWSDLPFVVLTPWRQRVAPRAGRAAPARGAGATSCSWSGR